MGTGLRVEGQPPQLKIEQIRLSIPHDTQAIILTAESVEEYRVNEATIELNVE